MNRVEIPNGLLEILERTPELGQAFLVGGCVRDHLLGFHVTDYDIEAYKVSYEALAKGLRRWGRVDLVGRSFGVIKLQLRDGNAYDFALPRRDSKTAPGHKGFQVQVDENIEPREAAERRDFTINSMMFDPRTGLFMDFFGGRLDLDNRLLRHTSAAFSEDPLRVLRGMQLASRFKLVAAPQTLDLCRSIRASYRELAIERVREEWFKWAARSSSPSHGLRFLREADWLSHFPEINALRGVAQEPEWHPEGDVFTHTCHSLDALVNLPEWSNAMESDRVVLSFAVLAHDFAKPATTQTAMKEGVQRIVSPGHEEQGGPIAEGFLKRIGVPPAFIQRVVPLVSNHLAHLQTATDRSVRRLALRLQPETIDHLCTVIKADQFGRPPKPKEPSSSLLNLHERARELNLQKAAPKPILMGRDLLERGLAPSPRFKKILDAAFEAQLESVFLDAQGAQAWLDKYLEPTL